MSEVHSVCVCERERDTEIQRERERERKTEVTSPVMEFYPGHGVFQQIRGLAVIPRQHDQGG